MIKCPFREKSVWGMSFKELSIGELSVGEMSVGEKSVGEMSVGEKFVGEMSARELSGYHFEASQEICKTGSSSSSSRKQ